MQIQEMVFFIEKLNRSLNVNTIIVLVHVNHKLLKENEGEEH